MITLDTETFPIEAYPDFPPAPVGVAFKVDDQPGEYLSWGHPGGNNATREQVAQRLAAVWDTEPLLFFNAPFDIQVLMREFNLPWPASSRVHDAMVGAFLCNPHAASLALKSLAATVLEIPPDEETALHDWIKKNLPEQVGAARKGLGKWIAYAPAAMVQPYAIGDVDRTYALHLHTQREIAAKEMDQAYRRECDVLRPMTQASMRGVKVDVAALERDIEAYSAAHYDTDAELHRILGDCNLDAPEEIGLALERRKLATTFPRTAIGHRSVTKETMDLCVVDKDVRELLAYRGALDTINRTFLYPWLDIARANNGRLHPSYHTVRNPDYGAKTGRICCSDPNLLNVPNEMPIAVPAMYQGRFPPLPIMRKYLLPEDGQIWLSGDIKSQEPRLMAYFADGELYHALLNDPDLDIYVLIRQIILEQLNVSIPRATVKKIVLGLVYGMGLRTLAKRIDASIEDASYFVQALYATYPEIKTFISIARSRWRNKVALRTLGGRLIPAEHLSGNDLSYRAPNHLIQGSAADQIKEAVLYHESFGQGALLNVVYDEINVSIDPADVDKEKAVLSESIRAINPEIPMIMEFAQGPNWADLS